VLPFDDPDQLREDIEDILRSLRVWVRLPLTARSLA